jgi:hypothetical protein
VVYFAGCSDGGKRGLENQDQTAANVETARKDPTSARSTVLDLVGGALGLVVFFVGIAIIVSVYSRASGMFNDIAPAIQQASMGSGGGDDSAGNVESGPVVARPGGTPLSKVAAEFGLKFLWLILIAFFGALIAAMGAKLAGAHRGKRT